MCIRCENEASPKEARTRGTHSHINLMTSLRGSTFQAAMDASRWSGVNSSVPFQVIRAHLSDEPRFCPNQTVVSTAWPNGTLSAGPRFNCSFSACTNGITEDACKALGGFNSLNGIVSLTSRHGTFWSPQVNAV